MTNGNFKITCLHCGEEIVLSKTENRSYVTDSDSIEIGVNYGGFIWIDCNCENAVERRFNYANV